MTEIIGRVISGSLSRGLEVRLEEGVSVEDIKVGRHVTIQGERDSFFGLVTDIALKNADPRIEASPLDASSPFIAQVLKGTAAYGTVKVIPYLTLEGKALLEGPQPAKTIPAPFSAVRLASEGEIERVFGKEDERHFYVGNPLDMETRICLDLKELVRRSNGVFGKSGTGKTFLSRLILCGVIQKGVAVNLVFDMHDEYGWHHTNEEGYEVKGLKHFFPSKVALLTLDEASSRRRGVSPDMVAEIGYQEVEPQDMETLRESLGLTDPMIGVSYKLARRFGRPWLGEFLKLESRDEVSELAGGLGEHEGAVSALHRRLQPFRRFAFLVPEAREDVVARLLEFLERGRSVVLEFGRYSRNLTAYILVANLLTRRLHEKYVERTEEAIGGAAASPIPLVITIEEAHKFLSPQVAGQTAFGTIAREMRKYNVTLLVVDQRPGGIDEEVMSQLGTRAVYSLENEKDIEAVLAGVGGKGELKETVSRLEPRQQALLFGHALPMPVVIRTREYGTVKSYQELTPQAKEAQGLSDLWE